MGTVPIFKDTKMGTVPLLSPFIKGRRSGVRSGIRRGFGFEHGCGWFDRRGGIRARARRRTAASDISQNDSIC